MRDPPSPTWKLNPYPLPWKRRVPTTGLPGSLSLCPHWKELLIQVVDLTTSSCSARVVSCFTQVPSTRSPFLGLVWRVDLFWWEGVSAVKRNGGENHRIVSITAFLILTAFPVSLKVWDGICMSGMSACARHLCAEDPLLCSHVLEIPLVNWSSLLPNPLLLSSPAPPLPKYPSTNGNFVCPPQPNTWESPRFFFPSSPFYQLSSHIHPSFLQGSWPVHSSPMPLLCLRVHTVPIFHLSPEFSHGLVFPPSSLPPLTPTSNIFYCSVLPFPLIWLVIFSLYVSLDWI